MYQTVTLSAPDYFPKYFYTKEKINEDDYVLSVQEHYLEDYAVSDEKLTKNWSPSLEDFSLEFSVDLIEATGEIMRLEASKEEKITLMDIMRHLTEPKLHNWSEWLFEVRSCEGSDIEIPARMTHKQNPVLITKN